MKTKIVIIGGVAGGASAAARLRRLSEKAEIIVLERGDYVSFANCGLPYYIGGVIPERADLILQTPESLGNSLRLDIRTRTEVQKIDRHNKQITAMHLATGKVYQENYDYLILSPGASPLTPPIPGLDKGENIFTLRTIPDADQILNFVAEQKPKKAVVIGGGFIGLEMAENLHSLGLEVAVVEMLPQVMAPLDPEMAGIIHSHLRIKGINLILNNGVKAFHEAGTKIELQNGEELTSDLTILSIGVRPEVALAKEAGLELGQSGGIKVDQRMRTSDSFIYAVGDAVEVENLINNKPALIPLAGPANKQGRIAADNILGLAKTYPGTIGTAIAQIFDLTAASVGLNEKSLSKAGVKYEVVHIHADSHVSYYPGAEQMSLKLIYCPETGDIFGSQIVGGKGVDKRIDILATAIFGNLKVWDLQELELAYAPPYGGAKDPINHLGFVADNRLKGLSNAYQWSDVAQLQEKGAFFLDVRPSGAQPSALLPNAHHIPLTKLRERLAELPDDEPIYLFCAVGQTAYLAERILKQHNLTAFNLDGGLATLMASKS